MSDRADHLTAPMQAHLARQSTAFISTADAAGRCRASLCCGPTGFVGVPDERILMFPAYGDVGLDHLAENPHIALLFADLAAGGLALHVAGRARIIDHAAVEGLAPLLRRLPGFDGLEDVIAGPSIPERWVLVDVTEAHLDGAAPATAPHLDGPAPATAPPPGAVGDDELSYLLPPAWQTVA